MKNIFESFKTRKFKSGTYSLGIVSIAVIIVVVINLLAGALPANITKHDLSYNQLYSLTETTKEFVKTIAEDVTIYVVAQTGTEDATLMEMLDNYKALSPRVHVETVDPVLHPNFATQYTSDGVSNGSMVVVSDKRSTIINQSDLYEYSFDYSTYKTSTTGYDGEGQITSALNYVTTDNIPVAYTLEGHNEAVLSETLSEMIAKNSFEVKNLSLYNTEAVPEDAGCLIINAPSSDISSDEADRIIKYLEAGGSVFVAEDGTAAAKPNLERVLEYYGVGLQRGFVVEESTSNFFYPYQNYLAPNRGTHDIMETLNAKKYNVLMAYSGGIVKLDSARASVKFEPLLTTSSNSFLRVRENGAVESISMAEGDIAGPCYVGVAVSEEHGDVETKLVVYSSAYTTTDEANASVNGSNYELVTSSLNWLAGMDSSIAVDAKSYAMSYLQITSADVNRWMVITVVIVPVAILACGFVVWFRRRRK